MKGTDNHVSISLPSEEKLKLLNAIEKNGDITISQFCRQAIRKEIQSLKNKKDFEENQMNFGM
jgi:metal-responsive CopG/Arc/MetJ family transcriptional regulator